MTHQKDPVCPSSPLIIPESRCVAKVLVIHFSGRVAKLYVCLSRWQQKENRSQILRCPEAVFAAGRCAGLADRCLLSDPAVLCEDLIPHRLEVTSARICCLRRDREGTAPAVVRVLPAEWLTSHRTANVV